MQNKKFNFLLSNLLAKGATHQLNKKFKGINNENRF